MSDKEKLSIGEDAFELPGGNESIFIRRQPGNRIQQAAHDLDRFNPVDYFEGEYTVKAEKDEDGTVRVKITTIREDGGKTGIAFKVGKGVPFSIASHHMKACFTALFRHKVHRILNGQEEETSS